MAEERGDIDLLNITKTLYIMENEDNATGLIESL